MSFKEKEASSSKTRRRKRGQRPHSVWKKIAQEVPGMTLMGEDPLFAAFWQNMGGGPSIEAPCRFEYADVSITVVPVPDRLWSKTAFMTRLLRIRSRMQDLGHRCILVPGSAINQQGTRLLKNVLSAATGEQLGGPTTVVFTSPRASERLRSPQALSYRSG